ncbi:zinc finger protein OZF-like [Cylas formicarius]|uniref:zinc finger protein OZF-like n=1 Tax=Cylas formicarius TaxID=197179 RepID=UPI0029586FC0|nr:zinc finger protein OZF-like [Cylas formicarius]
MGEYEALSIESFKFICRTCLIYRDIFCINEIKWEDITLKEILQNLIAIRFEDEDQMPSNMCKPCIKTVFSMYGFFIKCKNSERVLRQILHKQINETDFTKEEQNKIVQDNGDETEANYSSLNKENNDTDYDPDDPDELVSGDSSEIEDVPEEEAKNNKLINTIQTIKKEIKQIKVKNKDRLRKMQKAQMVSPHELPRPKRPYVKTKGPPFICITCQSSFSNYDDLRAHKIETKHRKALKFVCPYCQRKHDAYSKYLEHVRTHTGEKPNICPTCGKGFNFKTDLRRHMVLHSETKPYNCRFCNKGFTRKQYLTDHERKHTGEKLICLFCGKGFHSYSTLSYHEKTHRGPPGCIRDPMSKDKYYQCHLCDKVLLTEQTLKSHILLHGPKNFSCEKCGKTYISKNRLQDHIRFAHQEAKFPCSLCDKVYKQKGGLDIHMKSHYGQNIYPCEVCNKQFACKGSLYQHRRVHTGDTRYQCKECFHICINKRHLENHLRTHTGEKPFACVFCGKLFAQKANMAAHTKIHTGEKKHLCKICGKGFYDGRSLRKHVAVHEKVDSVS